MRIIGKKKARTFVVSNKLRITVSRKVVYKRRLLLQNLLLKQDTESGNIHNRGSQAVVHGSPQRVMWGQLKTMSIL